MNFRFAFLVAVAMIVSTILASFVFVSQKLKLVLIVALFCFCFLLLICFICFKKRFCLVLAIIVLIGNVPSLSIYFKAKKIDNNQQNLTETITVSGKIYKYSENLDKNRIHLYLEDVKILNDNETKDFYGNIYFIVYSDGVDTSKLDIGRFVTIKNAKISSLSLNRSPKFRDCSYISRDITATSFIFSHNLYFEEEISLDFRDKIKENVYGEFEDTDLFFTETGYAMLFGESSILDDEVYDVFKDSGVAHLLAVSGFHISVIVAFLSFILNKLKTNKYLKFSIIGTLLFSYAYLCSFSVSVVRASIMALLLIHATNRNKEYDKLSSLSLASILIFLINPMQLFNISFIFSFVSILSIILLMPVFDRLFSKFLCERLSSALSLSLSTSVGILVFQLSYFGKYPILSFLSNLITIPIVGALFVFLIISVLIGSVFGFSAHLISVFGCGMKYVVQFNALMAKTGLFLYSHNLGIFAMCVSVLIMFFVSDYVFVSKKTRLCVCGVLLSLLNALII